jgi:hypothetical protein
MTREHRTALALPPLSLDPSPARHKGKRKKEPVEDKSAVHSLAYAFHSAYRG